MSWVIPTIRSVAIVNAVISCYKLVGNKAGVVHGPGSTMSAAIFGGAVVDLIAPLTGALGALAAGLTSTTGSLHIFSRLIRFLRLVLSLSLSSSESGSFTLSLLLNTRPPFRRNAFSYLYHTDVDCRLVTCISKKAHNTYSSSRFQSSPLG